MQNSNGASLISQLIQSLTHAQFTALEATFLAQGTKGFRLEQFLEVIYSVLDLDRDEEPSLSSRKSSGLGRRRPPPGDVGALTQEQLDSLFRQLDTDADGLVSWDDLSSSLIVSAVGSTAVVSYSDRARVLQARTQAEAITIVRPWKRVIVCSRGSLISTRVDKSSLQQHTVVSDAASSVASEVRLSSHPASTQLGGHQGTVTCAAYLPWVRRLATGAADLSICVFDERSAEPLGTVRIAAAPLCMAIDERRHMLIVGCTDGYIRTYHVLNGHGVVVRSTGTATAAAADAETDGVPKAPTRGGVQATPTASVTLGPVAVLTAAEILPVGVIAAHKDWVSSLVVAPRYAVLISASLDRSVKVWSMSAAMKPNTAAAAAAAAAAATGGDGGDEDPTRGWTAVGAAQLDARAAQQMAETALQASFPNRGHARGILTIAFSEQHQIVLVGGFCSTIYVWNPLAGLSGTVRPASYAGADSPEARRTDGLPVTMNGHDRNVVQISVLPDGSHAASADTGGSVIIWNLRTLTPLQTLMAAATPSHIGPINAMSVDPVTGTIWVALPVGLAFLLPRNRTTSAAMYGEVSCMLVNAAFDVIFCAVGAKIFVFNSVTGSPVSVWDRISTCTIVSMTSAAAERELLVANVEGSIAVVSAASGTVIQSFNPSTGDPLALLAVLCEPRGDTAAAHPHSDGGALHEADADSRALYTEREIPTALARLLGVHAEFRRILLAVTLYGRCVIVDFTEPRGETVIHQFASSATSVSVINPVTGARLGIVAAPIAGAAPVRVRGALGPEVAQPQGGTVAHGGRGFDVMSTSDLGADDGASGDYGSGAAGYARGSTGWSGGGGGGYDPRMQAALQALVSPQVLATFETARINAALSHREGGPRIITMPAKAAASPQRPATHSPTAAGRAAGLDVTVRPGRGAALAGALGAAAESTAAAAAATTTGADAGRDSSGVDVGSASVAALGGVSRVLLVRRAVIRSAAYSTVHCTLALATVDGLELWDLDKSLAGPRETVRISSYAPPTAPLFQRSTQQSGTCLSVAPQSPPPFGAGLASPTAARGQLGGGATVVSGSSPTVASPGTVLGPRGGAAGTSMRGTSASSGIASPAARAAAATGCTGYHGTVLFGRVNALSYVDRLSILLTVDNASIFTVFAVQQLVPYLRLRLADRFHARRMVVCPRTRLVTLLSDGAAKLVDLRALGGIYAATSVEQTRRKAERPDRTADRSVAVSVGCGAGLSGSGAPGRDCAVATREGDGTRLWLGRYLVLPTVKGGVNDVMLAVDTETEQRVALKFYTDQNEFATELAALRRIHARGNTSHIVVPYRAVTAATIAGAADAVAVALEAAGIESPMGRSPTAGGPDARAVRAARSASPPRGAVPIPGSPSLGALCSRSDPRLSDAAAGGTTARLAVLPDGTIAPHAAAGTAPQGQLTSPTRGRAIGSPRGAGQLSGVCDDIVLGVDDDLRNIPPRRGQRGAAVAAGDEAAGRGGAVSDARNGGTGGVDRSGTVVSSRSGAAALQEMAKSLIPSGSPGPTVTATAQLLDAARAMTAAACGGAAAGAAGGGGEPTGGAAGTKARGGGGAGAAGGGGTASVAPAARSATKPRAGAAWVTSASGGAGGAAGAGSAHAAALAQSLRGALISSSSASLAAAATPEVSHAHMPDSAAILKRRSTVTWEADVLDGGFVGGAPSPFPPRPRALLAAQGGSEVSADATSYTSGAPGYESPEEVASARGTELSAVLRAAHAAAVPAVPDTTGGSMHRRKSTAMFQLDALAASGHTLAEAAVRAAAAVVPAHGGTYNVTVAPAPADTLHLGSSDALGASVGDQSAITRAPSGTGRATGLRPVTPPGAAAVPPLQIGRAAHVDGAPAAVSVADGGPQSDAPHVVQRGASPSPARSQQAAPSSPRAGASGETTSPRYMDSPPSPRAGQGLPSPRAAAAMRQSPRSVVIIGTIGAPAGAARIVLKKARRLPPIAEGLPVLRVDGRPQPGSAAAGGGGGGGGGGALGARSGLGGDDDGIATVAAAAASADGEDSHGTVTRESHLQSDAPLCIVFERGLISLREAVRLGFARGSAGVSGRRVGTASPDGPGAGPALRRGAAGVPVERARAATMERRGGVPSVTAAHGGAARGLPPAAVRPHELSNPGLHAMIEGVVLGVLQCHRIGIVHMDVKPSNLIFVTNNAVTSAADGWAAMEMLSGPADAAGGAAAGGAVGTASEPAVVRVELESGVLTTSTRGDVIEQLFLSGRLQTAGDVATKTTTANGSSAQTSQMHARARALRSLAHTVGVGDGEWKLLDFDCSRRVAAPIGRSYTAAYVAPEVAAHILSTHAGGLRARERERQKVATAAASNQPHRDAAATSDPDDAPPRRDAASVAFDGMPHLKDHSRNPRGHLKNAVANVRIAALHAQADAVFPADPSMDVWAVGLTLYEIIYGGQPLFDAADDDDVVLRNRASPLFVRAAVDARHIGASNILDGLIGSCLAFDPRERPSVADIAAALLAAGFVSDATGLHRRSLLALERDHVGFPPVLGSALDTPLAIDEGELWKATVAVHRLHGVEFERTYDVISAVARADSDEDNDLAVPNVAAVTFDIDAAAARATGTASSAAKAGGHDAGALVAAAGGAHAAADTTAQSGEGGAVVAPRTKTAATAGGSARAGDDGDDIDISTPLSAFIQRFNAADATTAARRIPDVASEAKATVNRWRAASHEVNARIAKIFTNFDPAAITGAGTGAGGAKLAAAFTSLVLHARRAAYVVGPLVEGEDDDMSPTVSRGGTAIRGAAPSGAFAAASGLARGASQRGASMRMTMSPRRSRARGSMSPHGAGADGSSSDDAAAPGRHADGAARAAGRGGGEPRVSVSAAVATLAEGPDQASGSRTRSIDRQRPSPSRANGQGGAGDAAAAGAATSSASPRFRTSTPIGAEGGSHSTADGTAPGPDPTLLAHPSPTSPFTPRPTFATAAVLASGPLSGPPAALGTSQSSFPLPQAPPASATPADTPPAAASPSRTDGLLAPPAADPFALSLDGGDARASEHPYGTVAVHATPRRGFAGYVARAVEATGPPMQVLGRVVDLVAILRVVRPRPPTRYTYNTRSVRPGRRGLVTAAAIGALPGLALYVGDFDAASGMSMLRSFDCRTLASLGRTPPLPHDPPHERWRAPENSSADRLRGVFRLVRSSVAATRFVETIAQAGADDGPAAGRAGGARPRSISTPHSGVLLAGKGGLVVGAGDTNNTWAANVLRARGSGATPALARAGTAGQPQDPVLKLAATLRMQTAARALSAFSGAGGGEARASGSRKASVGPGALRDSVAELELALPPEPMETNLSRRTPPVNFDMDLRTAVREDHALAASVAMGGITPRAGTAVAAFAGGPAARTAAAKEIRKVTLAVSKRM